MYGSRRRPKWQAACDAKHFVEYAQYGGPLESSLERLDFNPVLFTIFDEVALERYYNAMQTRHNIVISKKQKSMSVKNNSEK